MKKMIVIALLGLFAPGSVLVCDVCSAASDLNETGLIAALRHHYLSLSWVREHSLSERHFGADVEDAFNRLSLQGRFFLTDRWSVGFDQRFSAGTRTLAPLVTRHSGLGDLWLHSGYRYLNVRLACDLQIMAEGVAYVRIPIGSYDANIEETHGLPRAFNPGRGSWAGRLQHRFALRYGHWGLLQHLAWTHAAATPEGYRFGDSFQASTLLYRNLKPGAWVINPWLGGVYENITPDHYATGFNVHGTGGSGWWLQSGLMARRGSLAFTASWNHLLRGTYADGDSTPGSRLTASISYIF